MSKWTKIGQVLGEKGEGVMVGEVLLWPTQVKLDGMLYQWLVSPYLGPRR